jgi:hypothetical protein
MLIDLDDGYIDMLGVSKDESGNYISKDENGNYVTGAKKSRVRLDVEAPYFLVDDKDGNRLINIGSPFDFDNSKIDEGYYLKSSDFSDASASGLLFDLNKGLIKSYGFTLDARGEGDNKLLIDSTAQTHPLTIGTTTPKFKVAWDGTLEATGAIIFGNINAKDGNIGGWAVNEGGLYYPDKEPKAPTHYLGVNGLTLSVTGEDKENIIFKAGSHFGVDSTGKMYANSGKIGGWTITGTSLEYWIDGISNYLG